jgi:hypothetical protein
MARRRKTVELASIQQILKPKPVVEDLVWKGNIGLAMDYQRAEKTPTITTSTSRPLPSWSLAAHAEGEYNREFRTTLSPQLAR